MLLVDLFKKMFIGDGLNLYAYCGNNPLGYYNPSGYEGNIACPKSKEIQSNTGEKIPSRRGALREAKRDADIPYNQYPFDIVYTPMREAEHEGGHIIKNFNGKVIVTREYYYKNRSGQIIVIQDHGAGHKKGNEGSHFNVRPADKIRTGTKKHYPFKSKGEFICGMII